MTVCSRGGFEDDGVLRGYGRGDDVLRGRGRGRRCAPRPGSRTAECSRHQATIVVSGVIRVQQQMKVFGKFAKCWERALGDSNIWGTSTKSETHLYNTHLTFNKWETR
jgi:hypothetical protein